jgi:hypothetical protein
MSKQLMPQNKFKFGETVHRKLGHPEIKPFVVGSVFWSEHFGGYVYGSSIQSTHYSETNLEIYVVPEKAPTMEACGHVKEYGYEHVATGEIKRYTREIHSNQYFKRNPALDLH